MPDRVLAVVLFAVAGTAVVGLLAFVVVGWEALKSVVVAALFGGDAGGVPGWKQIVVGSIVLGFLGGAWLGWDLTSEKRQRRRRAGA